MYPRAKQGGQRQRDLRSPFGRPYGYPAFLATEGPFRHCWFELPFVVTEKGDYRIALALTPPANPGRYADGHRVTVKIDGNLPASQYQNLLVPPLRETAVEEGWVYDSSGEAAGRLFKYVVLREDPRVHLEPGKHQLRLELNCGPVVIHRALLTTRNVCNRADDFCAMYSPASLQLVDRFARKPIIRFDVRVTNPVPFEQTFRVTTETPADIVVSRSKRELTLGANASATLLVTTRLPERAALVKLQVRPVAATEGCAVAELALPLPPHRSRGLVHGGRLDVRATDATKAMIDELRKRHSQWLADPNARYGALAPKSRPAPSDLGLYCWLHREAVSLAADPKAVGRARCPQCSYSYGNIDLESLQSARAYRLLEREMEDLILLTRAAGDERAAHAIRTILAGLAKSGLPLREGFVAPALFVAGDGLDPLDQAKLEGWLSPPVLQQLYDGSFRLPDTLIEAAVTAPRYRNTIFGSRKLKDVQVQARTTPYGRLAGRRVKLTVVLADGNTAWEKSEEVGAGEVGFSFPAEKIPVGSHSVRVDLLSEEGATLATTQLPLRHCGPVAKGMPEVWFDEGNICHLSDKPIFPVGFWLAGKRQPDPVALAQKGISLCLSPMAQHKDQGRLGAFRKGGGLWVPRAAPEIDDPKFDPGQFTGKRDPYRSWPNVLAWLAASPRPLPAPEATQLRARYAAIRNWDAYRPVCVNLVDARQSPVWAAACDVLSAECSVTYFPKDKLPGVPGLSSGSPTPLVDPFPVERSGFDRFYPNLTEIIGKLESARKATGGKKPIWATLTLSRRGGRYPMYHELRCQGYLAIALGARGLLWRSAEPRLTEHPSCYLALLALGGEWRDLVAVLAAPDSEEQPVPTLGKHKSVGRPALYCVTRDVGEKKWLIVVNVLRQKIDFKMRWRWVPEGSKLLVYKEGRHAPISGDGHLTDSVPPFGVNVYTTDLGWHKVPTLAEELAAISKEEATKHAGNLAARAYGGRIRTNLIGKRPALEMIDGARIGPPCALAKAEGKAWINSAAYPDALSGLLYVELSLSQESPVRSVVVHGAAKGEKEVRAYSLEQHDGKQWQPLKAQRKDEKDVITYQVSVAKCQRLRFVAARDKAKGFSCREICVFAK